MEEVVSHSHRTYAQDGFEVRICTFKEDCAAPDEVWVGVKRIDPYNPQIPKYQWTEMELPNDNAD